MQYGIRGINLPLHIDVKPLFCAVHFRSRPVHISRAHCKCFFRHSVGESRAAELFFCWYFVMRCMRLDRLVLFNCSFFHNEIAAERQINAQLKLIYRHQIDLHTLQNILSTRCLIMFIFFSSLTFTSDNFRVNER